MIDNQLRDDLTRVAAQVDVGDPPTRAILTAAAGQRRRRLVITTITAAAVMVGAALAAAAVWPATGGRAAVVAATPDQARTGSVPSAEHTQTGSAAEMRVVGIGRAVIEVPASWGTNQVRCGTPRQDTVIIDGGAVPLCGSPWPTGVQSVMLLDSKPGGWVADERITVEGVAGERQRTTCRRDGFGSVTVCSGAVYLPSLHAWFEASAASDPHAVDQLLSRIQPAGNRIPVPGYHPLNVQTPTRAGERYAHTIRSLGLIPKIVRTPVSDEPGGSIVEVSPGVGAVLQSGATVTITVAVR